MSQMCWDHSVEDVVQQVQEINFGEKMRHVSAEEHIQELQACMW